jgi:hypothetical protein
MPSEKRLAEWIECVSGNMPSLSRAQALVLALWSFGIACTRGSGRQTVATFLAMLTNKRVDALEQRLYDWCLDAADKHGEKRSEVRVEGCFVPLLSWIMRLWSSLQVAFTLDATSLGERFVVLCVSIVYCGIGIPVAWCVLPAGEKHGWRREWLRLLRLIRPALASERMVIVLADRGLYAPWLYRRIVRLGWHPFLRINSGGKFRPNGQNWVALPHLVPALGSRWAGKGTAFITAAAQLDCTLLACWQPGYKQPWFILTDLDPTKGDVAWYALRAWCEQGFKCTKRGGWQWQQTQMEDPHRAARLWLAFALAMFWMVAIGSDLELPAHDNAQPLPALQPFLLKPAKSKPYRTLRLFRLGWLWLLARLINQFPLPLPKRLFPEPWPSLPLVT